MKKLSQTKRAKQMRKMRRTESTSDKQVRNDHNRFLKVSSQIMYAVNNGMSGSRNSRLNRTLNRLSDSETKALIYRELFFQTKGA